MSKVKGPQFQLDTEVACEKDILEFSQGLSRGRKGVEIPNLMIAGRALSLTCQPVFDLVVSAARRGEVVSLQDLSKWISIFSTDAPAAPARTIEQATATTNKAEEKAEKVEPGNDVDNGGFTMGQ